MNRSTCLIRRFTASLLVASILSPAWSAVEAVADPVSVHSWWSSEQLPTDSRWFDGPMPIAYKFAPQPVAAFGAPNDSDIPSIVVDPATRYQTYEGFGKSMEESTVFNLMRMSAAKREEVLRRLVDPAYPGGLGFNLMRITLGSSDFTAREFYTYNDMPAGQTDPTLKNFSIQKDIDFHIIGVLQQAMRYNPELRLIASPWTPPGWMKDNDSLVNGGHFLSEYIDTYATYLRKAVQAYAAQGLPIYAMSVQNEPLLAADYPSCIMSADQQRRLVIALKAQFDSHNIDTKIMLWDFNTKGAMAYLRPILDDPLAKAAVYGTAFHGYSYSDHVMSYVRDAYPDEAIMYTERTHWGIGGMERIANVFRNWAVSYNGWVTMLDSNKAPEQWTGTPGPTILIQDADNPDDYWAAPEYYLLQHYSRLVQRGARRIYTSPGDAANGVTQVAFLNPDNSVALVVMNQTAKIQRFKIMAQGQQLATSLPTGTMASYSWQATSAAGQNAVAISNMAAEGEE